MTDAIEGDAHRCACPTCDPALAPHPERISDAHVSVQLGDNQGARVRVLYDGEDISRYAYEALAGNPGWAKIYRTPPHGCRACLRDACAAWLTGTVQIVGQSTD